MALLVLLASSCTTAADPGGAVLARSNGSSPIETPPSSPSSPPVTFRADIPARAVRVTGGCRSTQVYRGPVPDWVQVAVGQNAPRGLPYVVAEPPTAAAFIFGYPLRAGHPDNPSNKTLWVVRTPRDGAPLQIEAHPAGGSLPVVRETRAADSGPGEIYPDGLDVPFAGCWHFSLRWQNGQAELDLRYVVK